MARASSKRRNRTNPQRIPTTLILEREAKAWELYSQGQRQTEIAAVLKVSQQAVSGMLKRVEVRVLAELSGKVERHKAQQTARLEYVISQAMAMWERSKKNAEKTTIKTGGENGTETSETSEGQHGDPRLLDQARGALADLRKIWGLDAPTKQALTDKDGKDVPGAGVVFYLPTNSRDDSHQKDA